jgi:hypothetical protein
MQIKELFNHWETQEEPEPPRQRLTVDLDAHTKARLDALAQMFPKQPPEKLVSDLLRAAVDEFERSLPYVPGKTVVEHDELGDPVYEDAGPTPQFQALTRGHIDALKGKRG